MGDPQCKHESLGVPDRVDDSVVADSDTPQILVADQASTPSWSRVDAGKTPDAARLRRLLQGTECHAPHLIDAELGNVLRRRTRAGDITPDQALTALGAVRDVIDVRYPHAGALARLAWTWRDNLSFYDALYVALADRLGLPSSPVMPG